MCACHKELEVKPTPTEKDIDQALDDSFPASDPPSYNIPHDKSNLTMVR